MTRIGSSALFSTNGSLTEVELLYFHFGCLLSVNWDSLRRVMLCGWLWRFYYRLDGMMNVANDLLVTCPPWLRPVDV